MLLWPKYKKHTNPKIYYVLHRTCWLSQSRGNKREIKNNIKKAFNPNSHFGETNSKLCEGDLNQHQIISSSEGSDSLNNKF